ncbi:MAG: hypothetical protein U5L45_18425 [Saprospiraceae bacterium]|nr:hypothetical protein [Saprospiraceae bacterium]
MSKLLTYLQEEYVHKTDGKLKFLLKQYTCEEIVAEIMSWLLEKKARFVDITLFARDFYNTSDLTKTQRAKFYKELEWQGFFSLLNHFLYDEDVETCSWVIYTFGKFCQAENAHFLETAYNTHYKIHNPILAARCLFEMRWLKSLHEESLQDLDTEGYVKSLEKDNSLSTQMLLLHFYDPTCQKEATDNLLKNKDLVKTLLPNLYSENDDLMSPLWGRGQKEGEKIDLDPYLWSFEALIFDYCKKTNSSKIEQSVFENLVKIHFSENKRAYNPPTKSTKNAHFEAFNTEGVILVGSAKRLKKYYETQPFSAIFSDDFSEIYEGQRMVWAEPFHTPYDLYLFENQEDVIQLANKNNCAYLRYGLFFESNDKAVVFNQKQFTHIMSHDKGDFSKQENPFLTPMIWHKDLARGFYELTWVEAPKGLAMSLERVTDSDRLAEHHFKGKAFLLTEKWK